MDKNHSQVQGIDQVKANMAYTDISNYLNTIALKFYRITRRKDKLCELNHIWDQSRPDYSNNTFQQYYSIRYTYAYAFEYKEMYRKVLLDYFGKNNRAPLKIESIGCGNMVDGWSLYSVLLEKGRGLNIFLDQIDYKGIDCIAWENPLLTKDHFINTDAVKWFENKSFLDANVYMFPKSIGDFSEDEFGRIMQAFSTKRIVPETLYLMASVRKSLNISSTDKTRASELDRRIINQGYKRKYLERFKEYGPIRINKLDGTLSYPEGLLKILRNMKERHVCQGFSNHDEMCVHWCDIDKNPMLNANNLCYLVMKYER